MEGDLGVLRHQQHPEDNGRQQQDRRETTHNPSSLSDDGEDEVRMPRRQRPLPAWVWVPCR